MPYTPGLGWLVECCPYAVTILLVLACLIMLLSLRQLQKPISPFWYDTDKISVMICITMFLTPLSLLAAIGLWFACNSILCGCAAGASCFLSALAFIFSD